MSAAVSRELLALINVAPIAREAVERHERDVLEQYERGHSTEAYKQAIADNNALNNAAAEALDRVALFEAETVADLHTKLTFMVKHDMGDGNDWLAELLADAERIISKGAAA